MKDWLKSKTLWTAIGSVVATVGLVAQGSMTWQQAMPVIVTAVVGVFVRDAVIKNGVNQ